MSISLNPAQQAVVDTLDRNVLLLAPAGTGKTDTIARRIAHILALGLAAPEEILCLTFTNKACKEMANRVEGLLPAEGRRVVVKTIHSLCYTILRQEAKRRTEFFSDFAVFDEEDCREALRDLNLGGFDLSKLQNLVELIKKSRAMYDVYSENIAEDYRQVVARLFEERREKVLSLCTDNHFRPDEALASFIESRGAELVLRYNRALAELHGMDFCDLVVGVYELFRNGEAARRWRERFRFLTVDEVQDTDELEYEILSKLFDGRNILLTGDIFQTVYEWRGSNPSRLLARYREEYDPLELAFRTNYRATRTLLRASRDCLEAFFPSEAAANDGEDFEAASPEAGAPISLKGCRDLWEEGEWIYRRIQSLDVTDPSRICVLTRNNRQTRRICRALEAAARSYAPEPPWPFMLIDEFQFFRRQEVKDALAFLKLAVNRHDLVSLRRVLKRFGLGIGVKTIEKIESESMRAAGLRLTDFLDETALDAGDPFAPLLHALVCENVVVFDVESTGVDVMKDEIVQIAAIRLDKDGTPKESFTRFLRNEKSVGASEAVHGFSDAFLREKGEEPRTVLAEFLDFLRGAWIVGHNVTYDISILANELERLDLPEPEFPGYSDTLDIFRRFYPNLPNHRLEFLGKRFEVKHKSSHDAFDDICATAELLMYAVEHNIRPTAEPRRVCIGTFGKVFRAIASVFTEFRSLAYKERPTDFLARVVKSQLEAYYAKEPQRMEHLRQLYRIVRERDDNRLPPREALQKILTLATLSNSEFEMSLKERPKTPVITVHQAKGLEFEYVFLAGLEDGAFPSFQAIRSGQAEEEKRLFYVAITRAKKELFLSWSQYGDYNRERLPSPFLSAIPRKYIIPS
ncbi:MAG: UvrD-helicase domain-containing protein [Schwartzia sp.]|nr:UvrD-helicase domain-containing protein [Schwartzia sp. (in: firmicutes)]